MKQDYAAYIGVDWASEKHAYSLTIPGKKRSESGSVKHSAESIRDWISEVHKSCGGKIAVCLEQSRGGLFHALSEYEYVTLFPVNPATSARYRQAFYPSGAKDDPTD